MNIEDKLKSLHNLQLQKIDLKNALDLCQSNIDMAQEEIVDEFESRQIKSMKLDGLGNFFIRNSNYPKITDVQTLRGWMVKNGIDWEVITALNAKKFQGFYNELLELGKELPPGVENYLKTSVVMVKE